MKRLVVCCDGTWNQWNRKWPTNVVKLARAVVPTAPDSTGHGVPQVVFYDEGVGTGNMLDRARGGLFGYGLDKNVEDAYRFLVNNYEPGDEVFLFGFSRGAYTARSVAGLIRKCGLLKKRNGTMISDALALYRQRNDSVDGDKAKAFRRDYSHRDPEPVDEDNYAYVVRIHFIGVWDTVGSLGIPLRSLRWIPWNNRYKFHDERLSRCVKHAYHAVSIDERRGSFAPTLWAGVPAAGQTVEQTWFAGVHSQVGGGSRGHGLSDIALGWMIDKATECGLVFDVSQVEEIREGANPSEKVDSSLIGVWRFLLPYNRPIGVTPPVANGVPNSESLHPSVCVKLDTPSPSYRPKNVLEYLQRPDHRIAEVGLDRRKQPPGR